MNKETQYLIDCLMEECAEVQMASSKAKRFELETRWPDENARSNAEDIALEYAHILGVMEMLVERGLIDISKCKEHIANKKIAVQGYLDKRMKEE